MKEDAEAVEVVYLAKVGSFEDPVRAEPQANLSTPEVRITFRHHQLMMFSSHR
jgi:hypothetical protein